MRPKQEQQVQTATQSALSLTQNESPTFRSHLNRGPKIRPGFAVALLFCLCLLQASVESYHQASSHQWNNGTRRQSRLIHLKAAPFNGRLSLAPPEVARLPAASSANFGSRQAKQLNDSSQPIESNEPNESLESSQLSNSEPIAESEHESNISALSPTLVLRQPPSPKQRTLMAGDFKLPDDWSNKTAQEEEERASQAAPNNDSSPEVDSSRLMASESVVRGNVKGGSETERENPLQSPVNPGSDSILSLIDEFDSTIITNRTKGEC